MIWRLLQWIGGFQLLFKPNTATQTTMNSTSNQAFHPYHAMSAHVAFQVMIESQISLGKFQKTDIMSVTY